DASAATGSEPQRIVIPQADCAGEYREWHRQAAGRLHLLQHTEFAIGVGDADIAVGSTDELRLLLGQCPYFPATGERLGMVDVDVGNPDTDFHTAAHRCG